MIMGQPEGPSAKTHARIREASRILQDEGGTKECATKTLKDRVN